MSNEAEREAFEAWLGITPCGAAHDLAVKAFQAGAEWQRSQSAPAGWPTADNAAQLALLALAIESNEVKYGGLRAAATALGIDPAYLSRLKSGEKKNPSADVLAALGLERYSYYRPLLAAAPISEPKCQHCNWMDCAKCDIPSTAQAAVPKAEPQPVSDERDTLRPHAELLLVALETLSGACRNAEIFHGLTKHAGSAIYAYRAAMESKGDE